MYMYAALLNANREIIARGGDAGHTWTGGREPQATESRAYMYNTDLTYWEDDLNNCVFI
jgi:hypothetical protein